MSTRLNKLLSNRGIGARRKCDEIIAEGRVRVNGRVVNAPGTMVEEQRDRVEVDGRPLPKAQKPSYFVINKPVGVITTMSDPHGRRTIAELLPRGQRLYPVGRLDADTSGLLVLTNDGDLAHKLMHPRYGVDKVYRVRLDREPARHQLDRLARGVEFEPGVVSAPARVRRIDPGFEAIMIEVIIHEGRFRQVRRMCEAVGLHVTGLHRVGYGPIRLGPLARGMWRELSEAEVESLRAVSARPLRRGGTGGADVRGFRQARPGRPARPARTVPPAGARRGPAPPDEDEVDEIEETWVPGGGMLPGQDDDEGGGEGEAEWPARAGRSRGDEEFRRSGGEPAKREKPALPWHAPEFRRGPKAAPRRGAPGAEGAGARGRAPRRDRAGEEPRPEARRAEGGRRAERRGPPTRSLERGVRDDRRGGAAARGPARAPRAEGRGGPGRSFERGPRRDGGGGEPARGSVRGPRAERGGAPPRGFERFARPARAAGPRARSGAPGRPARAGEGRAFSPRAGGRAGQERPAGRRGRPEGGGGGRSGRPESRERRQRKR